VVDINEGVKSPQMQSDPWLSARKKLSIVMVVSLLAMSFFVYQAFSGAMVYYVTVGELLGRGEGAYGETLRLSGKLVPTSFVRTTGTTQANFSLTDGNATVSAFYAGPVPDLFFNEHSDIILEGEYGKDGAFHADNIIVKCPTKYQAEDEEQTT